ncbi:MAG TPA: c-type cytochrome, partial [Blastocatellia bacterium]|nr:c-type cytochrome [Blastocatellia bacterium]
MRERIIKRAMLSAGALLVVALFAIDYNAAASATPSSLASFTGSPAAASGDDGATLFGRNCAVCHGKGGQGLPNWKAKGQPDFTDAKWQKSRTDAQVSATIQNGKG